MKKIHIISLGGSLIVPYGHDDLVNASFLKQFKKLLEKYCAMGHKFILVVGGGNVSRKYQNGAAKLLRVANDQLDNIGIAVTKVNAELLKTVFYPLTNDFIADDPTKKYPFKKPVVIGCGWKPGRSTDAVIVELAKTYKIDSVINISNKPHVYDSDPRKNKDAKKIKHTTWDKFFAVAGDKWHPGLNTPFDPVATKNAAKLGLTLYDFCGWRLKNFENFLDDKKFTGTIVQG